MCIFFCIVEKLHYLCIMLLILPGNLIRDDGKSCWAVSKSYRLNAAKSSRTRNILNRSDEKVHYRS